MDGAAVVWCEGAFDTPTGKTAHGLVRRTRRYRVVAVVDSRHAGADAGQVLDGRPCGIPVVRDLAAALAAARAADHPATHMVIGLAPDGGRMDAGTRHAVLAAVEAGLNVDAGLHDFLSEDAGISAAALAAGVQLRDVRRTPPRAELHAFSGRIQEVTAFKLAVLGTDSAVGKRTTAWLLADALTAAGARAEMIGTGQTAWLQGARYGILLDALINDFVAGELEHAVVTAWQRERPDVLVIEGQGSLMNPAYPGGLEILAAARPDVVVMQHAPARREYDGFPGHPLHPLDHQIRAVELLSGRPVVAIAVNHEDLPLDRIESTCRQIEEATGLVTCDPLLHGAADLARAVLARRVKGS